MSRQALLALLLALPTLPALQAEPDLEQGDLVEGDIRLPPGKNGILDPGRRWPGAVIPYTIDAAFNALERGMIEEATNEFHRLTCVRWVPRGDQRDYVHFAKGRTGCWSYVGRIGGRQIVNLQIPGCTRKGTRVHEMMHAVGFWHEQSRADRDYYIRINLVNVIPDKIRQFDKVSPYVADPLGVGYDYGSVMHYPPTAFSKNGLPTITSLRPLQDQIMGQRGGLAKSDYWKINRMYNCTNYPRGILRN